MTQETPSPWTTYQRGSGRSVNTEESDPVFLGNHSGAALKKKPASCLRRVLYEGRGWRVRLPTSSQT